MLFIATHTHWKLNWLIFAFNLIIFYCFTTIYSIYQVFKIFSFIWCFSCRFCLLFKILYLKRFRSISFVEKRSPLSSTQIFHYQEKYIDVLLKGVYTEKYLWRIILFLIYTCYTSSTLLCILKENCQKQFLLFSHFCWG